MAGHPHLRIRLLILYLLRIRTLGGGYMATDKSNGGSPGTKHVTIVCGPSKFNRMVSLFNGEAKSLYVTVNEVRREDGSGEAWLFKGAMTDRTRQSLGDAFQRDVSGNISTARRTGWLVMTLMGGLV
jgi:hypothetical protein